MPDLIEFSAQRLGACVPANAADIERSGRAIGTQMRHIVQVARIADMHTSLCAAGTR